MRKIVSALFAFIVVGAMLAPFINKTLPDSVQHFLGATLMIVPYILIAPGQLLQACSAPNQINQVKGNFAEHHADYDKLRDMLLSERAIFCVGRNKIGNYERFQDGNWYVLNATGCSPITPAEIIKRTKVSPERFQQYKELLGKLGCRLACKVLPQEDHKYASYGFIEDRQYSMVEPADSLTAFKRLKPESLIVTFFRKAEINGLPALVNYVPQTQEEEVAIQTKMNPAKHFEKLADHWYLQTCSLPLF
jgi:hypothetical protein